MQGISSFIDSRFPVGINYQSSSIIEHFTNIIVMSSGHEQRSIQWERSRMRFHIAKGVYNTKEMEELRDFFRVCRGRATAFRFKDWADYKISKEVIDLSANNPPYSFHIQKRYFIDNYVITRKITKPIINTIKLYYKSGEILKNWSYSDDSDKILLGSYDKNREVILDCEFDVPVRFNTDTIQFISEGRDLYSCGPLDLVEVK